MSGGFVCPESRRGQIAGAASTWRWKWNPEKWRGFFLCQGINQFKLLGINIFSREDKVQTVISSWNSKKWMFGEITMFYIKIWNHPIETTIKNGCLGYQDGLKWLSKGFRFNFGVCVVATVPNLLKGTNGLPCRQPEWLYTMIQRRQRKKGDENLWKKIDDSYMMNEWWWGMVSDEWMNDEWRMNEWWMNDVWMMNECWMDDEWMMNEWWVNGDIVKDKNDERILKESWTNVEWIMNEWWLWWWRAIRHDWWQMHQTCFGCRLSTIPRCSLAFLAVNHGSAKDGRGGEHGFSWLEN